MVSARRNAEIRWGLGLVAFLLTLVSLAIFIDFPSLAGAAGWGLLIGVLLVALFFYLLLPSRNVRLSSPPPSRPRRRRG